MSSRTYDEYWSTSGYQPVGQPLDSKLRALFEAHTLRGTVALDLGCGDGSKTGVWFAANDREYHGVDISNVAVELARQRGLSAQVVHDGANLPFADASIDFVVCSEVLEHLAEPLSVVTEARRILRPGGRMIATVPNIAHWRSRVDMLFGRFPAAGDSQGTTEPWRSPHIRFFTPTTFRRFFEHADFKVLESGGYQAASQLFAIPVLRRFARRRPSRLAGVAPGLLAGQCYVVAEKPAGSSPGSR